MRFYTVHTEAGDQILVSVDGGRSGYLVSELGFEFSDMNDLILHADEKVLSRIQEEALLAYGSGKAAVLELAEADLRSPILKPLQDVVCLGINYDDHAAEAGRFSTDAFGGERPYTIYFSKRVNRAIGSGEPIPSHQDIVDSLDYECELGVILGKTAAGVSAEEAPDYVFGYTVINDITARSLQTRHKQWYLGKSLDGFTAMGPCIVTPDELGDPAALDISCYVNDELRQNSNTRFMIQTIGGAIAELSAGMTLEAGSVIAMGTPSGVGMGFNPPRFLQPGDVVRCHIEKIGDLINRVE